MTRSIPYHKRVWMIECIPLAKKMEKSKLTTKLYYYFMYKNLNMKPDTGPMNTGGVACHWPKIEQSEKEKEEKKRTWPNSSDNVTACNP